VITVEQLARVVPCCEEPGIWVEPLNVAMVEFGIDKPVRVAAFLAQVAHESGELTRLVENLNYSAERLQEVFRKYFTADRAREYARKPERIANYVYADRNGNGPMDSGDGWRFRGRGLLQVTGRANYQEAAEALDVDLVEQPELLERPDLAARSAGAFWRRAGCNGLADTGEFKTLTRRINGGVNGLSERLEYFARAKAVLGLKGA
jgi:putative chitinase